MGHGQNCRVHFGGAGKQKVQHCPLGFQVEISGGLIREDQLRLRDQRPAVCHTLLSATPSTGLPSRTSTKLFRWICLSKLVTSI